MDDREREGALPGGESAADAVRRAGDGKRCREVTFVVTSSLEPGSGRDAAALPRDVETWLGVEGIELTASHGVYESEMARGNRFRVDVHVKGAWSEAVRSDALRDTLDYDRIVETIHGVSRRRRFHLIESFAGAIAADVAHLEPQAMEVRVCVRKLSFANWGPDACARAVVTLRPRAAE